MEERSSKRPRPSGDWKPYEREEAPDKAEEKPKPSGDWKPYERGETDAASKPGTKAKETPKVEAKPKPAARVDAKAKPKPKPAARTEEPPRDHPRSKEGPRDRDERAGQVQPANVDAMGQDKHREVIGQHGANRGRQFLYYGIFVAFVIGAYIGLKAAADSLDKAPAHDPDQAPWSKPNAPGGPLGGFTPKSDDQQGATDFQ